MALSKIARDRLATAFGITAVEQEAAKELADALDYARTGEDGGGEVGPQGPQGEVGPQGVPGGGGSTILTFLSEICPAGYADAIYTVTGLLATDTIIAVTPVIPTTTNAWMRGFKDQGNNTLTVSYNADPAGAGKVLVAVVR